MNIHKKVCNSRFVFLLFVLFSLWENDLQAQERDSVATPSRASRRFFVLKTQPFQPLIRKYSISGELRLKNHKSLQLQAAYWDWGLSIELSSLRLNLISGTIEANEFEGDLYFRNVGFQAEWRSYLIEETPLEGLYFAPALNLGFTQARFEVTDPDPFSLGTEGTGNRNFTAIGGNLSVGYQLIINRLAFDAFLGIGAFYNSLHQVEITYSDGRREQVDTSIPRILPFPRIGLSMGIAF
ncbi:DUF3575 domain-containing protein [Hugenholtzia roseola]|uniref:DUF3575 domain-containing protein n=1 Tax=Hugenholtzia roseola TaxID=1002 RepID=UPI001376F48E|nr:DUF3575 domain-containing protein [Hugenholtzia roseola]